jgi:hypothetical protein
VARTGKPLVCRATEWLSPSKSNVEDPYFATLDALCKPSKEGTASVPIQLLRNRLALMVGVPAPLRVDESHYRNVAFDLLQSGSLSELQPRINSSAFVQDSSGIAGSIRQTFNNHGGFR